MHSIKTTICAFALLFLTGCTEYDDTPNTIVESILGRDNGQEPYERDRLWRIRRPALWIVKDTPPGSIQDSRIPNIEYDVDGIAVFIHSFPSNKEEERIPPIAQIERWKRQFDKEPEPEFHLSRQAFSGYAGILFDGRGCIKGKEVRMLAWAIGLSPSNYFTLRNFSRELRSDITIKVIGVEEIVDLHEVAIRNAARSFELIEAIP